MEQRRFQVRVLDPADRYIKSLAVVEQIRIAADITLILDNAGAEVRTKQLKGPVRELIVGNHRITYFKLKDIVYFVRGFRKKTTKTPQKEIGYAEDIHKQLSSNK